MRRYLESMVRVPQSVARLLSDHCYMYRDMPRYGKDPETVTLAKVATMTAPLRWQLAIKAGKRQKPFRVFTCSWSDFFIKEADPWRDMAWGIILRTPDIIYQILTKRPDRAEHWLKGREIPRNVWLIVSAENQEMADARLPVLARIPAKMRGVSVEPLLGPVDLRLECWDCGTQHLDCKDYGHDYRGISWVVVGGESGPNFRSMQVEWLEAIVEQCRAAGVACFVKQDSGLYPGRQGRIPDRLWKVKEPWN